MSDVAPNDRLHDDLMTEYFKLVDLVSKMDERLLTIKGWGVTLSLASLGFGFQQDHYGLFLVAALSGAAFWIVEGTTKYHAIRYYPRMRDIECAAYELYSVPLESGGRAASPLIDWGWRTAQARTGRGKRIGDPRTPQPWVDEMPTPIRPMLWPHVMFPHVVAVVAGLTLFVLGLFGVFSPI